MALKLTTSDGVQLEALHDPAKNSGGVIVLCHPHPQHGGTMRAPMLGEIANHGASEGFDVLRFNFRGVGESTGIHGNGLDELRDIADKQPVVLLDYETNDDARNLKKPLSHASLVVKFLDDAWHRCEH